jgi:hypothetical protein
MSDGSSFAGAIGILFIENWTLGFGISLGFGIWILGFSLEAPCLQSFVDPTTLEAS